MYDVNHIEVLPELFALSLNFNEPIGILVRSPEPHTITGIVEDIEDEAVCLDGRWISLDDVLGVED